MFRPSETEFLLPIVEYMMYFILLSPCRMPQKNALVITIGPIVYYRWRAC